MILGGIALIIFIIGLCITRPWVRYYSDNKIHFDFEDFANAFAIAVLGTFLVWFFGLISHSFIESAQLQKQNIEYFTEIQAKTESITEDGIYFEVANGTYYIHYYNQEQIPLIYTVDSKDKNIRLHSNVIAEPPYVIVHTYKDNNWIWRNLLIPRDKYTLYEIYIPNENYLHIINS